SRRIVAGCNLRSCVTPYDPVIRRSLLPALVARGLIPVREVPGIAIQKTNTNMFVIACVFNIPRVEDSRIRKFLSPRRKDAKFGKEKIGLLRSVVTILFSDLCELSAFARDIASFDCGCSPTGEPLFSSPVWGKACTAIRISLLSLGKFSEDSPQRRRERRVKMFLMKIHSELCELRASAVKSRFLLWLRQSRLSKRRQDFITP
ncbi:MAG: hypothetical protein ACXW52_25380, partial [Candidatus Binatia bacterium]